MKRLYHYISMVAAKLVGRRHVRDVDPPGMKELLNAFVSKSDSAITARPDFDPISEDPLAISGSFADETSPDEYLNSATGLYGTDDILLFSNLSPITWDGGESVVACSNYTTGTVSGTNGERTVTGVGTSWLQNAWAGCFIEIDGDGKYYKIATVDSNTSLTVTADLAAAVVYSGDTYEISRTHQPDHGDYKLNLQPFTSGMIYSCPSITMPIESNKICGPFYASVVEVSSENAWTVFTDDDVQIDDFDGTAMGAFESIATDGTNWLAYCGTESGSHIFAKSSNPTNDWESVACPPNFTPSGFVAEYNGVFYIAGKNTSTTRAAYAYTTDMGSTWNVKDHDSDTNSAWAVAVNTSGRVVLTVNNPGSDKWAYYTDDNGASWSDCVGHIASAVPYTFKNAYFINSTFLLVTGSASYPVYYYSSDGETFSLGNLPANYTPFRAAYSTSDGTYSFTTTGPFVTVSELGGSHTLHDVPTGAAALVGIVWAGDKFIVSSTLGDGIYSTTNGTQWETEYTIPDAGRAWSGAYSSVSRESVFINAMDSISSATDIKFCVSNQTQTSTEWRAASFEPLSDEYRALSHSVLDGYVVLLGTREFQSSDNSWNYYPRRIRWSAPLTYNDFSSSGSGSAELDGSGALLDSRAVNGRIVTFESSAIGAISPRGYATDPWEYDRIKDNIRAISNPVVVDDLCYFIDDSGLLRATNGIAVESPPFSFDLTEYDDFNADSPVWLAYSPELESLVVYNPDDANRYVYLIDTEGGTVARIQAASLDLGGASSESPRSVVCVENSSDRRLMLSYNPDRSGDVDSDATKLLVAELSTGSVITGKDEWTAVASMDTYHNQDTQTPEISIVPEGTKTGIKHIIARTYTDGTSESTNPILVVQCKSVEDTSWHDTGDRTGNIVITDSLCASNLSDTAWSNTMGAAGSTVYDTPCLAKQARIYVGTSLKAVGTDYTITGPMEITFNSAASDTVYAYWENEPSIRVTVGDMIQSEVGWHRITGITDHATLLLDHYLPAAYFLEHGPDYNATHHPGTALPTGDGEVKIGISKLVEGVQLRFLVFHRSDGDATVTKITGATVGHIPSGEKIVKT